MILSWLVKQSLRAFLFQEVQPVSYTHLKAQRDTDYTKLKAARAEVAELQKIRKCVDIALKAEQPEQTQNRTKRQEQER